MDRGEMTKRFHAYLEHYDLDGFQRAWSENQQTFRDFWKNRMLAEESSLAEADYDPIIRMLDSKAKGFNRGTDVPVAMTGIHQGLWYRMFNDLKEQKELRMIMDEIFNTEEENALIELVNRLEKVNEKNKNGLTGARANALNALLCLNNSDSFISMVSLSHREQVIKAFDLGNPEQYQTYGEKVIRSNGDILNGFEEKFGLETQPRALMSFLYFEPTVRRAWKGEVEDEKAGNEDVSTVPNESEFAIEKQLEDFLVANWESTELSKSYDLIEEDGEMVSQQYTTNEVGNIDLLVKEKKSGCYVVIELKKGQTSDVTVGQLTRYMAWVQKNKADGGKVKGIVIAGSHDSRLEYALQMVPNTKLLLYRITFSLQRPTSKNGNG